MANKYCDQKAATNLRMFNQIPQATARQTSAYIASKPLPPMPARITHAEFGSRLESGPRPGLFSERAESTTQEPSQKSIARKSIALNICLPAAEPPAVTTRIDGTELIPSQADHLVPGLQTIPFGGHWLPKTILPPVNDHTTSRSDGTWLLLSHSTSHLHRPIINLPEAQIQNPSFNLLQVR